MADAGAVPDIHAIASREERGLPLRWLLAVLRFARRKPLGAFGGAIMFVLLLLAVFGEWVAPQHYADINVFNRFVGPTPDHLFGTDDQGRDILSRVIFGARASVIIGLGAVIIATIGSSVIGIVSGYYGGLFDLLAQRVIDAWQAFPGLIFVIFIISVITSNRAARLHDQPDQPDRDDRDPVHGGRLEDRAQSDDLDETERLRAGGAGAGRVRSADPDAAHLPQRGRP